MTDHQAKVCAMVHDLRAKDCEATRLILADLLEEGGRPGVEDRTTKHLRAGRMVLASLDMAAVGQAHFFISTVSGCGSQELTRLHRFVHDLPDCFTKQAITMEPARYVELWQTVVRHVALVQRDDVRAEAKLLMGHADFVPLLEKPSQPEISLDWAVEMMQVAPMPDSFIRNMVGLPDHGMPLLLVPRGFVMGPTMDAVNAPPVEMDDAKPVVRHARPRDAKGRFVRTTSLQGRVVAGLPM